MRAAPPIRIAHFINHADLCRAQQTLAKEKAKDMMGAGNSLIGSKTRKPASTFCAKCSRWHRPGNLCPSMTKSNTPRTAIGERALPALDSLRQLASDYTTTPELTDLKTPDLLTKPEAPQPKRSTKEDFSNASNHLRSQSDGYLTALRSWQMKYGGR